MAQDSNPDVTPTSVTTADVANAKNLNLSLSAVRQALGDGSTAVVTALTSIASAVSSSLIGGTTGTTANRVLVSKGTGGHTLQATVATLDPATGDLNLPGTLGLEGSTSGIVTIQPQAAAGTWNFNLPITAGTSGQVLTSGGGGSSPMTWVNASSGSGSGLTVGSTAITSGTSTRILYDNAGVLGEYTSAQATAFLNALVGDSGAGGTKGLVPAPSAGDAAAVKALMADGSFGLVRKRLTAAMNFYVRTDGSDSNDGLTDTSGGAFASIAYALQVIRQTIDPGGNMITIQVADGTYSGLASIQPQLGTMGEFVQVIGNTSTPANCLLVFNTAASADGFYLTRGDRLFMINGFKIRGSGWSSHGVWTSGHYGAAIKANFGGGCIVGANMQMEKYYYGVSAMDGGTIFVQPGVTVDESGDSGFFAFGSGRIECRGCTSTNASHIAEDLGNGFIAEQGGSMTCIGSTATGNRKAGYLSQLGGAMWAHQSTSTGNQYGYHANENGSMEASEAVATSNTGYGFFANLTSYILADDADAVTNTFDGFVAQKGSVIFGNGMEANTNGGFGFRTDDLGQILGTYSGSGNSSGLTYFGQFLAYGAGDAALPAYSWQADPNTGFFNKSADTVGFSAGGVERWYSDTTGLHLGNALEVASGGTGITSFGTGIATWLGTPSSANLAAAVTDETGSGALVFGTSPTLTTSLLLGSGFVINWNSSDVTLTHAANLLTMAGGNLTLSDTAARLTIGPEGVGSTATPASIYMGDSYASTQVVAKAKIGLYGSGGVPAYGFGISGGSLDYFSGGNHSWLISDGVEMVLTTTELSPGANDGSALGTNTISWADLFLATGGVINWANGNLTLTHSSGILTQTGSFVAAELRANGDVGGAASQNALTNVSDVSGNSTGVGTIKFKGTTARDSTGFIKIYVGTTAYYVPIFSAITG